MSGSTAIYELIQPRAFVGMKVDSMNDNVDSYPVDSNIPFGRVCAFIAPNSRRIRIGPAALAGPIAGISLHDHIAGAFGGLVGAPGITVPLAGYRQYDSASILRMGRVWAEVLPATAAAIQPGMPVFFEFVSGLVSATAAGGGPLRFARFRSTAYAVPPIWPSASLGGSLIAEVEIDDKPSAAAQP